MGSSTQAGEALRLWSLEEAAAFLGKSPGALHTMRWRRIGPPSFKVGRHVRFRPEDVIGWVADQATQSAAEYDTLARGRD